MTPRVVETSFFDDYLHPWTRAAPYSKPMKRLWFILILH
jgi:hypothetical protein